MTWLPSFKGTWAPPGQGRGQSVDKISMLVDHASTASNNDSSQVNARDLSLCVGSLVYHGAVTERGKWSDKYLSLNVAAWDASRP